MSLYVIPKKWYVKYISCDSCGYTYPPRENVIKVNLGFAIPYADEKSKKSELTSFNKRKVSVDNWVGSREHKTLIFDNEPVDGFKIRAPVSRYYNHNVFWRVIDPRGFELEIDTSNLEELFNETVIDKGLIKGKAIWSKNSGGKPHLLVEGTNPYNESKDVVTTGGSHDIGDIINVIFKNKIEEHTYYGKIYFITKEYIQQGSAGDWKAQFTTECRHVYKTDSGYCGFITRKEKFKDFQLIGKDGLSKEERIKELREKDFAAIGYDLGLDTQIKLKLVETSVKPLDSDFQSTLNKVWCFEMDGYDGYFHSESFSFRSIFIDFSENSYKPGEESIPRRGTFNFNYTNTVLLPYVKKITKCYDLYVCYGEARFKERSVRRLK